VKPERRRPPSLADIDLSRRLTSDEEAERLVAAQRRLLHLRLFNAGLLERKELGPPVLVVFEGWDASGKGGCIRRLVADLDPRHVRVAEFGKPTYDELRHHFLWRFSTALPGWGGMSILDRSWYGRVLVERVEELASPEQWGRAYQEITRFEQSMALEGMVIIKLWLHISHSEQLRRFEARRDDPLKRWKLTDEDWRNRQKRPQYEEAVDEMLARTDHRYGHWDVIAAEQKRFGRVAVLDTVIARMEEGMRREGVEPPPSKGDGFGGTV